MLSRGFFYKSTTQETCPENEFGQPRSLTRAHQPFGHCAPSFSLSWVTGMNYRIFKKMFPLRWRHELTACWTTYSLGCRQKLLAGNFREDVTFGLIWAGCGASITWTYFAADVIIMNWILRYVERISIFVRNILDIALCYEIDDITGQYAFNWQKYNVKQWYIQIDERCEYTCASFFCFVSYLHRRNARTCVASATKPRIAAGAHVLRKLRPHSSHLRLKKVTTYVLSRQLFLLLGNGQFLLCYEPARLILSIRVHQKEYPAQWCIQVLITHRRI